MPTLPDDQLPKSFQHGPKTYQEEYGYLFGFIPLSVNSSLFDVFDYFEFPQWYEDYTAYNKFQDQNRDIIKASIQYVEENNLEPPELKMAFYGDHLNEKFDNQRNIRRGYENYIEDMDIQRDELERYGQIQTRQTTSRQSRFYDNSCSLLPHEQHAAATEDGEHLTATLNERRREPPSVIHNNNNHQQSTTTTTNQHNFSNFTSQQQQGGIELVSLMQNTPDNHIGSSNINNDTNLIRETSFAKHASNNYINDTSNTKPTTNNINNNNNFHVDFSNMHDDIHQNPKYAQHKSTSDTTSPQPPEIVNDYTFDHKYLKTPNISHYFYETAATLAPKLLIEIMIPFSMNLNVQLAWISPVGAWGGAVVSCLLIYCALHISSSFVNSGILALVIGIAGFQQQHAYFFFCHGIGQFFAHLCAYNLIPGYVTEPDNINYVVANLGVPGILTITKLVYHPIIISFFESLTLGVIAISFTGKQYMKDASTSAHYFICTGAWSYIVSVFRPNFPIVFDCWWGFIVPIFTYVTHPESTDWESMVYAISIFPVAVLCGAYIAGILCRASMHLEQRRYERYGHFAVHKLLTFVPPPIRDVWYHKLRNKQYEELQSEIDHQFTQTREQCHDNKKTQ